MPLSFRLVLSLALLTAAWGRAADKPMPEWKDAEGAVFRGEPVEIVGPLALWRTGATTCKFMPLRRLSPEDCVRFHQGIAGQPARAAHWSEAKGRISGELVGRLQVARSGRFQPVDMKTLPEPEWFVMALVGDRPPESTGMMLANLIPFFTRVQRVYPGRVAPVLMGFPSTYGAWLVVDPRKQRELKALRPFSPGGGVVLMLMTRHGMPLMARSARNVTEVMQFVDAASNLLWQLNPANPGTARDRSHYLQAIRPVEFAQGKTGPLLLADMIRPEGVRQLGVSRIEAKIEVAADGAVTGVELLPESEIPARIAPAITDALRRTSRFVPAIDQGAPVADSYRYSLTPVARSPQLVADTAWVTGEARLDLPIKSWLVLKAVRVPELVFGAIDRVGADGTVMMKAVSAGDASKISISSQKNSFNTDWFAEKGAGSVAPVAGDVQEIDGTKLTWKQMTPEDGLVDFLDGASFGSYDYCIGYAWAEVESPDDRDAWLGIGSDDGLKVWVNGELVNDQWIQRISRLDDDVVPLKLKKGKNQILIKIQNMKGRWSFTARLRVKGG